MRSSQLAGVAGVAAACLLVVAVSSYGAQHATTALFQILAPVPGPNTRPSMTWNG
eukprot:CAMPEP_0173378806 /NCGR_PEP_ID=MMETSP1356-20130122/1927_1 /TAXON_ID=77927 ORGANISM="Hemiselmis virescens, Strain PCC157" /NCGR_SAMPLE_ID=MMETSP1356 /ASSEMBLY_ACC=CAM_ASM_000847 /LENGTH=54 /DNA_ID=CAMNT_0014331997 /DNA_START=14 /DNA_END=174 /DNA_ORIENTATION=+